MSVGPPDDEGAQGASPLPPAAEKSKVVRRHRLAGHGDDKGGKFVCHCVCPECRPNGERTCQFPRTGTHAEPRSVTRMAMEERASYHIPMRLEPYLEEEVLEQRTAALGPIPEEYPGHCLACLPRRLTGLPLAHAGTPDTEEALILAPSPKVRAADKLAVGEPQHGNHRVGLVDLVARLGRHWHRRAAGTEEESLPGLSGSPMSSNKAALHLGRRWYQKAVAKTKKGTARDKVSAKGTARDKVSALAFSPHVPLGHSKIVRPVCVMIGTAYGRAACWP